MCARRWHPSTTRDLSLPTYHHRSASAGTDQLATLQQLLSLAQPHACHTHKPLRTSSQQLYLYPSRSRMSSMLSRSTHLSSLPIGPPSWAVMNTR
jgi:hypothetical protein